jgi:hypothetical protein
VASGKSKHRNAGRPSPGRSAAPNYLIPSIGRRMVYHGTLCLRGQVLKVTAIIRSVTIKRERERRLWAYYY